MERIGDVAEEVQDRCGVEVNDEQRKGVVGDFSARATESSQRPTPHQNFTIKVVIVCNHLRPTSGLQCRYMWIQLTYISWYAEATSHNSCPLARTSRTYGGSVGLRDLRGTPVRTRLQAVIDPVILHIHYEVVLRALPL